MTVSTRVVLIAVAAALSGPVTPLSACTNVRGIPADCVMRVFECEPPGAAVPKQPLERSCVRMQDTWAWSACTPSNDGAVDVVHLPDAYEVHFQGARHMVPRGGVVEVLWDSSERRFAFWAAGRRVVGVADVRSMSGSPPFEVAYEAGPAAAPVAFSWVSGRDELLVLERRDPGGAVVLVDVTTRRRRDLLVDEAGIDAVYTLHHRASAGAAPVALVGASAGLLLLDCASGQAQALGVPSQAITNFDLSLDGARAVVLYRRSVTAPNGQQLIGVHLLDLDGLRAGKANAVTQLDERADVHTLWLSPAADQVLWATPRSVVCHDVATGVTTEVLTAVEGDPDVKGACFDPTGSKLAITQGNRLLVHDVATGVTAEVHTFGDPAEAFAAEPRWTQGRLLVSVFEDGR